MLIVVTPPSAPVSGSKVTWPQCPAYLNVGRRRAGMTAVRAFGLSVGKRGLTRCRARRMRCSQVVPGENAGERVTSLRLRAVSSIAPSTGTAEARLIVTV